MPNPNKITEKVFQSPSKYIQGPNAIKNGARYLSPLGNKPFLVADSFVYDLAGKSLTAALESVNMTVTHAIFGGETCTQEITRLSDLAKDAQCDFVIALGGGKTCDTAKAIADTLKTQVAILPTTASTDAPCSACSVIYTPEGTYETAWLYAKNPALVLVDTSIIVKAPARFLSAGIGDALATNVEARQCRNSPNVVGGLPTAVSEAICQKCEDILFKYGKLAYEANKVHAISPAFEAVVEANTLLSGLGFESGGLAAAHAIHNGLTSLPAAHRLMHGEKVAFGTVCQLVLANEPAAALDRYIALMLSVDLPVTFEMLGCRDVGEEQLRRVARLACAPGETIWNMDSAVVSAEVVYWAMLAADAAGREYIRRTGWQSDAPAK